MIDQDESGRAGGATQGGGGEGREGRGATQGGSKGETENERSNCSFG